MLKRHKKREVNPKILVKFQFGYQDSVSLVSHKNHAKAILMIFYALVVLNCWLKLAYASNTRSPFHIFHNIRVKCHYRKIIGSHLKSLLKVRVQNFILSSWCIFGRIILSTMNPNSCTSKPYFAHIAQNARPTFLRKFYF